MRVETAIKMIENHGLKAFVTPEGLACVCEVVDGYVPDSVDQGDFVFEEVTTFPVYSAMMSDSRDTQQVSLTLIRNWLGY